MAICHDQIDPQFSQRTLTKLELLVALPSKKSIGTFMCAVLVVAAVVAGAFLFDSMIAHDKP